MPAASGGRDSRNRQRRNPGLNAAVLTPTHEVTVLLKAWREGDETALDALMPLVHDELRRIARRCLHGDRANHSVQATELVNEAFLRLVDVQHLDWQNRTHFLAMSARLMRRVLVDLPARGPRRSQEPRRRAALLRRFDRGRRNGWRTPGLVENGAA
jgi:RNA polymerase sigma factor (TIGR02999 family)